jgi:hypothetical protein
MKERNKQTEERRGKNNSKKIKINERTNEDENEILQNK